MKTLRSKLTVVFAFFAVVALVFGIGFMPKQASAAVDTSTGFYIEDGASIRTEEGESGIKWTAHISEEAYAGLNTEANPITAIGIAIQPQGNKDSKLDIHYEYGDESFEIQFVEGDFEYSYAIYYDDIIKDIEGVMGELDDPAEKAYLLQAYQTILEARPFVKHADGSYSYGKFFDTARSLQGVALGHLVAGTYAEGSVEDTLLKSFLPKGYNLADTEYVADSYYSNYDAWGNIAINSAIPMANSKVYYRGNDVTDAYNKATGLLELTAEDKVSTSITTDGSANEYLVIYDEATGNTYKQSFVGVTLAINDVADLDYFKLKSKVWWGGNGTGSYGAWEWWFEDTTDYIWDGYYVLLNNIDATGYTHNLANGMAFDSVNKTGNDFNRLDFTTNCYGSYLDYLGQSAGLYRKGVVYGLSGTFDGLGHTISNMNTANTGLLGHILGGTVKNLGMDNWTTNSTTVGRLAYAIARDGKLENIFVNTAPLVVGGGYSAPVVTTIGSTVSDIKNVVVYDNSNYMTSPFNHEYYTGSLTGDLDRRADYLTVPFNAFDGYYVVSNKALIERIPANVDPTTGKVVLLDAEYIDGVKNETAYTFTYNISGFSAANQPTKKITAQAGTRRYTSLAEFKKDAKNLDFSSFDGKYWTILEGIPRFVSTLKLDKFVPTLNGSNIYNVENNQTFTIDATYEGVAVPNVTASIVSGEGATLKGLELTVTKVGAVVINVQGAQLSKNITINVNPEIVETDKQYNFSGVDGLFFDDNFNVVSISTVFEDINNVTNVVDHNGKTLTVSENGALLGMDTSAKDWEAGYVIFYTADAGYKVFLNVAELIIDEATDFAFFGLKNPVTGSIIPADGEAIFDGYYVLSKNIDMSSYTHQFSGTSGFVTALEMKNAVDMTASGKALEGKYLTGVFDGQGYTLNNLKFQYENTRCGGLFGIVNGGTIKNVAINGIQSTLGSNTSIASSYSGILAGFIVGKATISDVRLVVDGSRNNGNKTGIIARGIDSTVTLQRMYISWNGVNMPADSGILVEPDYTDELLSAKMTDCYYVCKLPAALDSNKSPNSSTTSLSDGTVVTGKRYHKVLADAKYVDDVENTTKTAKTFHQTWSLTTTVSTDTHKINLDGKTLYEAPYSINLFTGLKRYTTSTMMNTATALANNDFSNWPGVWTIVNGVPEFTSKYTLSTYTATLNGAAYDTTSNVVDLGAVNTVEILRSGVEQVNKPSLEVISGKDIVSINGNTFKGIAGGDAVIKVVFGPVSHLIPITVDPSRIAYEHEYQFSATDGVIFDGANVVNVSDIVTDNSYSKITDKDGNELTLSDGKILGITTSTKDWEDNQIIFHYADYVLIVNVQVAELIIDQATDLDFFTAGNISGDGWGIKVPEGSFKFDGYYVLAKNINATGYTHNLYKDTTYTDTLDRMSWNGRSQGWYASRFCYDSSAKGIYNGNNGLSGVFDGQGYSVSNLTTNRNGLFGLITTGSVQNVAFFNCKTENLDGGFLARMMLQFGSSIKNVYVETPEVEVNSRYAPLIHDVSFRGGEWNNVVVIDRTTLPTTAPTAEFELGSMTAGYWHGTSWWKNPTFGNNDETARDGFMKNNFFISDKPLSGVIAKDTTVITPKMDTVNVDGKPNTNGAALLHSTYTTYRYTSQSALTNDVAKVKAQLNILANTGYFTVSETGVIGWVNASKHNFTVGTNYCEDCKAYIADSAETLQTSMNAIATATDTVVIEIEKDIDLSTISYVQPAPNGKTIVINGNENTISGMTVSLFGVIANSDITVNDLYIDGAVISEEAGKLGYVGVFGTEANSVSVGSNYAFNNVHVKATVTSTNYAGGFLAYVGNNQSSSSAMPTNTVTITDCSFEGTITGGGSVGAIIGHNYANLTVTNFEVKAGSTIECTEDRGTSARKGGALLGTSNGPVVVSGIVNNGTVVNVNGAANADNTDLYGRLSGNGTWTVLA